MQQNALTAFECMHYYSCHANGTGHPMPAMPPPSEETSMSQPAPVDYRTEPGQYRHWSNPFA